MILPNGGLHGLSAVNRFMLDVAYHPPAGETLTASTGKAPGFSITPHHFQGIYEEMHPGYFEIHGLQTTDPPAALAKSQAQADAFRAKQRSLAVGLPPCPIESITDNGASCYNGRGNPSFTPISVDEAWGLIMPGTFQIYGVPMTPQDLKDGRLTRVFKPDALQRKLLEFAVISGSQNYLFGSTMGNKAMNPFTRPLLGEGHIRDAMRSYLQAKTGKTPTQTEMEVIVKTASVTEMMEMVPDIKPFLINFERNPIQPDRWYAAPNGWSEWIQNGGYPLSWDVAHSRVSVAPEAISPGICASILCQCPTSQMKEPGTGRDIVMGGVAACLPACLNKEGIGECKPSEGSWWPYVAVYEDVSNPLWELTIIHNDPSWVTEVGNQLASWMISLGKLFCGVVAPVAKKQILQAQADVCTDGQGQLCTRGTPGCTCRPAPSASTASAQNMNLYVQAAAAVGGEFCDEWNKEYADHPMPPPDPLPLFPPPQPKTPFKVTPTMIAIGLATVGAAVLLTRKKKPVLP